MKTLILTDMHNEDPFDFLSEQREKGIEKFVCLGDCDNPSIVKRILELDIEKRFAVGNHDFFLPVVIG